MKYYSKIQQDALKIMKKEMAHMPAVCMVENFVYIATNAYFAVRIPEDEFFLNTGRIREMKSLLLLFADDGEKLKFTNELKVFGKATCNVLKGKDFTVYVDSKYLKLFNGETITFHGNGERSAVKLMNNGEVIAVIMPVKGE